MVDLSVVVLSYNTKELLGECLKTLQASFAKDPDLTFEIIIIDNNSTDGSQKFIEKLPKKQNNWSIVVLLNKENLGFGRANNQAATQVKGKYLLLLNSDTQVTNVMFSELIHFFEEHPRSGVLTVKILLSTGKIDPACHRGYPTLWRSFTYFSKLESLTRNIPILSKVFGGYHLTHLGLDKTHEIESPSGAFYMTTKQIYDEVGRFDEQFFMYGEDLDLSLRIKKAGYSIWYYPHLSILHIKGQSGIKGTSKEVKKNTKKYFYEAMKIFYNKHYATVYPFVINKIVFWYLNRKLNQI